MQEKIHSTIIHYMRLANDYYQDSMPIPTVNLTQRGKTAGSAWFFTWEIRLNPVLLNANLSAFLHQVIPHEIAHLVVSSQYTTPLYRPKPHGREWQFVMENLFSTPAQRCHSFDISKVQGPTFPYVCACQTHRLSQIRHNKVQRKQTRYYCSLCQQELIFKDDD